MYTTLIVDDEPKHRRCLAEMVRSLRPEYTVYEAKNGNEALELTKTRRIDIVITDIRMPIMDGLSLMEYLNESADNIKVVILSGFAYFEYAQKALTLGAFDYVLKPVNEAKISEILVKVEKAIEKENIEQQEKMKLEKQLNTTLPAYVEHKLNDWVKGFLNSDGLQEIEKIFPFKGNGFIIAIEITGLSDALMDYSTDETYEVKLNIKQWMKETLDPIGHTLSFFLESCRNTMITILNSDEKCHIGQKNKQDKLKEFIQNMQISYNLDVFIGIGNEYDNIFDNSALSFNESLQALNNRTHEKTGEKIFFFPDYVNVFQTDASGEHVQTSNTETQMTAEKATKNDKIIRVCEKYVSEHYMEDIPLESMAEIFHFNPSYFSSYFKNNTGINFSDYLQKIRMEKAKELLRKYNLKIYEVAEKVGYRNVKYFNKVFKKEFGISPDEYRRIDGNI